MWSEVFGAGRDGAGAYLIKYFFYVLWSMAFIMLCALLVRTFAPYAVGSGITEVSVDNIQSSNVVVVVNLPDMFEFCSPLFR